MCIVRWEFGLQITKDVGRLLHMKCFNSSSSRHMFGDENINSYVTIVCDILRNELVVPRETFLIPVFSFFFLTSYFVSS